MTNDFPLRTFRASRGMSLDDLAAAFGCHKTTVARVETGELPTDADMVDKIVAFTQGEVSAVDMHEVRLAWLRAHRPEKFPKMEAAE